MPKYEMRGVWISTVLNIDYPSSKHLDKRKQKEEFVNLLNTHKHQGFNTVFVQVRPSADAFYRSKKKEPWSEYLSEQQGKKPGYDPLKFMIAEAHKRGMELHAWINPYRLVVDKEKSNISARHPILSKQPDWVLDYGQSRILNPGKPEVQNYIVEVVMDIVRRYDIDGIHFDDYFYPHPIAGQVLNDEATYAEHGRLFADKAAWRRNNISNLIRSVYYNIKAEKPYVKFGVSPFGVWRNKNSDGRGSDTRAGIPTYDSGYADTRLWLRQGWVDYVAPQLYWSGSFKAASFDVLSGWWASNNFGRHIYVGHAVYKVNNDKDEAWKNPTEIPSQIRKVQQNKRLHGSIFFSSSKLNANPIGVADSLVRQYKQKAVPPPMSWIKGKKPSSPLRATISAKGKTALRLAWRPAFEAKDELPVGKYALYFFPEGESVNTADARYLFDVVSAKTRNYSITKDENTRAGTFAVTAIDRAGRESEPVILEYR